MSGVTWGAHWALLGPLGTSWGAVWRPPGATLVSVGLSLVSLGRSSVPLGLFSDLFWALWVSPGLPGDHMWSLLGYFLDCFGGSLE